MNQILVKPIAFESKLNRCTVAQTVPYRLYSRMLRWEQLTGEPCEQYFEDCRILIIAKSAYLYMYRRGEN
jgi:hypothetical protein